MVLFRQKLVVFGAAVQLIAFAVMLVAQGTATRLVPGSDTELRRINIMHLHSFHRSVTRIIALSLMMASMGLAQMTDLDRSQPAMPNISLSRGSARGNEPLDKLSP